MQSEEMRAGAICGLEREREKLMVIWQSRFSIFSVGLLSLGFKPSDNMVRTQIEASLP
jgi:hypothetical protein